MQLRVVVLGDGTIQIFGEEGPFSEAKEATESLLALLAERGVPVELVGEVEQHRPDVQHVHLRGVVKRER